MDILIKGMEMPKPKLTDMPTIYDAYVLVSPNGHAVIVVDDEDGLDSTEYHLIPVPKHGRLIDADALEQNAQKRLLLCNKKGNQFQKPYEVMRAIALAPTIIRAEKGET